MKPVTVGRYRQEDFAPLAEQVASGEVSDRWLGWVETEDWIVYEHADGSLYVWNGRNHAGGVTGAGVVLERGGSLSVLPAPETVE